MSGLGYVWLSALRRRRDRWLDPSVVLLSAEGAALIFGRRLAVTRYRQSDRKAELTTIGLDVGALSVGQVHRRAIAMALLVRVISLTVALLLALATTAAAAGHRTVAVCSSPAPSVSGIVNAWDAGATSHVRGWAASYEASGDLLCAGTVEVVADLQLNPGLGGLHGTVLYRLAGIDGGWSGTFEQQWAFDKGLLTYGREAAKGFGALAGWQLRATLSEAFDGTIVETDEIFAPGS